MDDMNEILLSDDKFSAVSQLREALLLLNSSSYCSWGSFLSSIHFKNNFTGSFELLVHDEVEALEALSQDYEVDSLHGTVDLNSPMKLKIIDAASKNEMMSRFLIEHSEPRTCVVANKNGEVEKFDLEVPRRGATLIAMAIDASDEPSSISALVEKIIWSLENIGVGPLLREVRYAPGQSVARAADIIEDLLVNKANKTVTILQNHATGIARSKTAGDLKKLGRPYAALLRA